MAKEETVMGAKTYEETLAELPPDKVVVRGGQVVSMEDWCCWNGENHRIIHIQRLDDGRFSCYMGDPEHGGGRVTGKTIALVTDGLHPSISGSIIDVFTRTGLTEEDVRKLFPKYKIVAS